MGIRGGGVPIIGDNVFLCTGAKVFGNIQIENDVIIGANAVVNKSVEEKGITVAGIPARKINEKSSRVYLDKRLFAK